jgi:glycosyltransferase involved in cell wall biosynthesis
MQPHELRIALFSGNYHYVLDGANQALNRLVGYLLSQGAQVRIYSPTVENPAFPATGEIVHVPSFKVPRREEYRIPMALTGRLRRDLVEFDPNVVHVSSPDIVAHRVVSWARARKIPVVASVHTRFDTYLAYYNLEPFEPLVRMIMRRFYRRCDALLVPAESTAAILRAARMNRDIAIWSRGVDRLQFNPGRRDMTWRRSHGIADDEEVIAFLGRVVMEKGLDEFADAIDALAARGVKHHVLVIGDGPARQWFQDRLPDGLFIGHQVGEDLGRALASADLFFNPSVTEAFGNVTLEARASGLPVVAAVATGATSLVVNGVTGTLVDPGDTDGYADALEAYARDPALRARHGAAGLAFAESQDWDLINSVVEKVYERVIKRRRKLTAMRAR